MTGYEWIYKLRPVREVEPGWWKLRWRPLKNGTWNLYTTKGYPEYRPVGVMIEKGGAYNGWGRRWSQANLRIGLWLLEINLWIRWGITVMEEGPQDVAEEDKRPLSIQGGGD